MELESVDREEVDRETVAYPERDEEDIRKVAEEMNEVETEREAAAVEEIRAIVNNGSDQSMALGGDSEDLEGLRGEVGTGSHYEAPIRSLNNPEVNTVKLSDGEEVQIAGEEFGQISPTMPRFDYTTLQWWVAASTEAGQRAFREENWNPEGEHIRDENPRREIKGYRVEVDGEVYEGEELVSLANRLRVMNMNDGAEPLDNNAIDAMIQYQSLESASSDWVSDDFEAYERLEERIESELEGEADEKKEAKIAKSIQAEMDEFELFITEGEFTDEFEGAIDRGLVTEDGNITLKGFLHSVDLDARDLRTIEELNRGNEVLRFDNTWITHEESNLSVLTTGGVKESVGVLDIDISHPEIGLMGNLEESGRMDSNNDQPVDEGYFSEVFGYLESQGFSIDQNFYIREDSREGRHSFRTEMGELLEFRSGIDWAEDIGDSLVENALDPDFDDLEVESVTGEFELDEEIYEALDELPGIDPEEVRQAASNLEISVTDEGIEIDYETESDAADHLLGKIIEEQEYSWSDFGSVDLLDFSNSTRLEPVYLSLMEFEEEINQKAGEDNGELTGSGRISGFFQRIGSYDELSEEARQRIEKLAEHNIIDLDFKANESVDFRITADDPLEYREVISELDEVLDTSPHTLGPGVYLDKKETDYEARVETVEIKPATDDLDQLEEALNTVPDGGKWDLASILSGLDVLETEEEYETQMDYERSYRNGIADRINAFIDSRGGTLAELLQGTVVPEPEENEIRRLNRKYESFGGEVDLRDESERGIYQDESLEVSERINEGNVVELLEDLEDAGIIEFEFGWRKEEVTSYGNEVDRGKIERFYSLDQEQRQKLNELRDRGLIEYDDPDRNAVIRDGENYENKRVTSTAEAAVDSINFDDMEVEVDVNYYTDRNCFEPSDQAYRVAEALDPMNLDKERFEQVEIDPGFEAPGVF